MKRIVSVLLASSLLLAGCASESATATTTAVPQTTEAAQTEKATEAETSVETEAAGGIFTGKAQGFHGDIVVEITVDGEAIKDIQVTEHSETEKSMMITGLIIFGSM